MRAVNRIFSVLDAFSAEAPRLTLQEISERIQLSKATTFRLVNSLCDAGYLAKLEEQKYSLSMKLIRLAGVVASGLSVRDIAHRTMVEVARETGETIFLNSIAGQFRVCIDVIESESRLMHIVKLGEHAPLYYGATGKVLLAHLPDFELDAILETLPPSFPMTAAELKSSLDAVRKDRNIIARSERVSGSLAISVAIFDINNKGSYALTLTGPEERMRVGIEKKYELMLEAQSEISSKMGSSLFPRVPPGSMD